MEEITRIKRELVHKGVIIDYYTDTMKMPDGREVEWDFIKHKGAAAVVPVTEDGKILMVRQYRNTTERLTLEIPAGGLNPGEEPIVSAARELEEETGFSSDNVEYLYESFTTIGFSDEKIYVYVARDLKESKQNLDEDEYVNVEKYDLEELIHKIYSGEIQDLKTIAALLAYKNKYLK